MSTQDSQPENQPTPKPQGDAVGLVSSEFVRRLGRFRIQSPFLRQMDLRPIFGEMVVVHAEMRWDTDSIEYVAMCDRFDVLEEGLEAPLYQLTLHTQEDGKLIILNVRKGIFA